MSDKALDQADANDWIIVDIAFDDPALDDFTNSLTKDTSALVLVGADDILADYEGVVGPLGGKLVKTNLNEDDVKKIKKALKD